MGQYQRLNEILKNEENWPIQYLYKFIVARRHVPQVEKLLSPHKLVKRPSRSGNYISVSFTMEAYNSEQVIEIYKNLEHIEGIISL